MTPWEVLVLHPFFVLFRFYFLILAFFLVVFFLHPWVTHCDRMCSITFVIYEKNCVDVTRVGGVLVDLQVTIEVGTEKAFVR